MLSTKLSTAIFECLSSPLVSDYISYQLDKRENGEFNLFFSSDFFTQAELEVVIKKAFERLENQNWCKLTYSQHADCKVITLRLEHRYIKASRLDMFCDMLSFPLVKLSTRDFLKTVYSKGF